MKATQKIANPRQQVRSTNDNFGLRQTAGVICVTGFIMAAGTLAIDAYRSMPTHTVSSATTVSAVSAEVPGAASLIGVRFAEAARSVFENL